MSDDAITDNLRIEEWPDGWIVFDPAEAELGEVGNYGVIAGGIPDEAEARRKLEDYRLEKQLREWEDHVFSEELENEMPF